MIRKFIVQNPKSRFKWIDFPQFLFIPMFSLDLLAGYQRRNHSDALFIQSETSHKGKWGSVDYYFVARFTRGFSNGYQTIDDTVFDEVWLWLWLRLSINTKFHFHPHAQNLFFLTFKVQRAVAKVWIGNGSKSNRISNCNDTWSSPMEMQLSIGQQSSWSSFDGNPSGFAGNESSLVWIVSNDGHFARMLNARIDFSLYSIWHKILRQLEIILWMHHSHRYDNVIVFDTTKCYENKIPMHFDVLTQMIHNCCLTARNVSTKLLHCQNNDLASRSGLSICIILFYRKIFNQLETNSVKCVYSAHIHVNAKCCACVLCAQIIWKFRNPRNCWCCCCVYWHFVWILARALSFFLSSLTTNSKVNGTTNA